MKIVIIYGLNTQALIENSIIEYWMTTHLSGPAFLNEIQLLIICFCDKIPNLRVYVCEILQIKKNILETIQTLMIFFLQHFGGKCVVCITDFANSCGFRVCLSVCVCEFK